MLPSLSNSLTVEDDSHNDKVVYVVVVSLTVLFPSEHSSEFFILINEVLNTY